MANSLQIVPSENRVFRNLLFYINNNNTRASLPGNIAKRILEYLDINSLSAFSSTSRRAYIAITQADDLWENLLKVYVVKARPEANSRVLCKRLDWFPTSFLKVNPQLQEIISKDQFASCHYHVFLNNGHIHLAGNKDLKTYDLQGNLVSHVKYKKIFKFNNFDLKFKCADDVVAIYDFKINNAVRIFNGKNGKDYVLKDPNAELLNICLLAEGPSCLCKVNEKIVNIVKSEELLDLTPFSEFDPIFSEHGFYFFDSENKLATIYGFCKGRIEGPFYVEDFVKEEKAYRLQVEEGKVIFMSTDDLLCRIYIFDTKTRNRTSFEISLERDYSAGFTCAAFSASKVFLAFHVIREDEYPDPGHGSRIVGYSLIDGSKIFSRDFREDVIRNLEICGVSIVIHFSNSVGILNFEPSQNRSAKKQKTNIKG